MLHKHSMLPSVFADLPMNEKAFIIAAIDLKIKHDKAEESELKRKAGRKK